MKKTNLSAALAAWTHAPAALLPQLRLQSEVLRARHSWDRQAIKWEQLARRLGSVF